MNILKNIALAVLPSAGTVGMDNAPAKEAWLEKTLKTLPAGIKILDAGAGELAYKKFCTHLDYTSQDFDEYDGASYKTGKWDTSQVDIHSDITTIPVPDASFDAIMCVEVFEHIPEPAVAVREFARILKPGGILITTAPFCSTTHQQPYYFANGLSRYWYEKILPESGFEIQELKQNGNFFSWLAGITRMAKHMAQTYSTPMSAYQRFVVKLMLAVLNTLERNSKGSEEISCFGIYTVSRKR